MCHVSDSLARDDEDSNSGQEEDDDVRCEKRCDWVEHLNLLYFVDKDIITKACTLLTEKLQKEESFSSRA